MASGFFVVFFSSPPPRPPAPLCSQVHFSHKDPNKRVEGNLDRALFDSKILATTKTKLPICNGRALPLLCALSAYLLKSLRRDNGRAAKITLLGPENWDSWAPTPAPNPILLQPGPGRVPSPSPDQVAFLLPCLACTCAWTAPPPPPRPRTPFEGGPDLGCRGDAATAVEVSGGNARACSAGVLGILCVGGNLWVRFKSHLKQCQGDAREVETTLPHRLHFSGPFCWSFLPPSPPLEPGSTEIPLLGQGEGWGRGAQGEWGERTSVLARTEWRERWVGAVARVRTSLWFPAPRAGLGREEGGFGCSHRPGLTLSSGGSRTVGAGFILKKERAHYVEARRFEDRTSCRDSVKGGECRCPWSEQGEAGQLREKRWSGWVGGSVRRSRRTMTHQLQHGCSRNVGQSHWATFCLAPTPTSASRAHSSSFQQPAPKSKFKIKFEEENIVVLGLFYPLPPKRRVVWPVAARGDTKVSQWLAGCGSRLPSLPAPSPPPPRGRRRGRPAPFHAKPAGKAGLEWRSRRAQLVAGNPFIPWQPPSHGWLSINLFKKVSGVVKAESVCKRGESSLLPL